MNAPTSNKLFPNYTQIAPRVPPIVWWTLRIGVLAITLATAAALVVRPLAGLTFFWGIVIPLVPGLLVIAPGLWRQVCPMAFLNQLPRTGGFSLERTLPDVLRDHAFSIAVGLFFLAVASRVWLLNINGMVVAAGIAAVLMLAFVGGLVFKGRSGWCGTFCPLGPIQRDYGQAPLITLRNGYCTPCVGCQKNCYDFNPAAAIFADHGDADETYAGQRHFFMAMMPGLTLAYFLQGDMPAYGKLTYVAILLGAACCSVGSFHMIRNFLRLDSFRAGNLYAALAVLVFYVFSGPVFIKSMANLFQISANPALVAGSKFAGIVLAAALIASGWRNNRIFRDISAGVGGLMVAESPRRLEDRPGKGAIVRERKTGKSFSVAEGQTLLDAMEVAGLPISFGCRSGQCGADPVAIYEGAENLSPMGDDERATLSRLGLVETARLACTCYAKGPVEIDIDMRKARKSTAAGRVSGMIADAAAAQGIGKVVIVGNGVAGMSAAEALRRASASVDITIIAGEPHHFYNRMAIGSMIHGRSTMDDLHLLPAEWYDDQRVDVRLNTIATAIDRKRKLLHLGTGQELPYDRLVLATGARSLTPCPGFDRYCNCFVLRNAEDALAIRSYVQANRVRRAIVIGGGILGVEAADALRQVGVGTTILQRSDRLMERQLDQTGALRLTRFLEKMGVSVVTNAVITGFEGGNVLHGVELGGGTMLYADLFIASVGIAANVELATHAGLVVDGGVRVDAQMRTSDPDIFAIGDTAKPPGAMVGLWSIGSAQAIAAVSAMLGNGASYVPPRLVTQLKCDGIDLRSFGEIEAAVGDKVFEADSGSTVWWRLIEREGTIVGAAFVGPPGSAGAFTAALKEDATQAVLMKALNNFRCKMQA